MPAKVSPLDSLHSTPTVHQPQRHAGAIKGMSAECQVRAVQCCVVTCAGHYQGQEVAVKVADPYYSVREQSCKAERIIQEVWTYQQMQGIPAVYGTLVPELLAFIRLPHDTFILVVSKQGQSLSDYVDAHKCVPDAAKVLDSLSKLHSCGVIHGGPRFDNITFRPDCTDVCFIDLQRAHVRNYCWKANSLVHDRSMRQWRKPNYDEQLAQGSESLAKQIMEQIECRTKEHEYVSNLLAQDYSQLTGSCAKFQRGKFPVNY